MEMHPHKKEQSLTEMSNEELWQLFPIILTEHQAHWKDDFQHEAELLKEKIGSGHIEKISHIGSTAIPGLLAKPTIDILLEVKEDTDLDKLIAIMGSIGYIYSPQPHKPEPHMMFLKRYMPTGFLPPVFHVHVRYPGVLDEIYFRDYLLEHPETAKEYGNLKLKLKQQFEHDRDGYTEAKTEFIQRITSLAKMKS